MLARIVKRLLPVPNAEVTLAKAPRDCRKSRVGTPRTPLPQVDSKRIDDASPSS